MATSPKVAKKAGKLLEKPGTGAACKSAAASAVAQAKKGGKKGK